MVASRSVPRDLLPLPLHSLTGGSRSDERSLGRACAQRCGRSRAIDSRLKQSVSAFNSLYGEGDFDGERPSEAQHNALSFLRRQIGDDVPPPDGDGAEASLKLMLGARDSCYQDEGSLELATMGPSSKISWPTSAGAVKLVDVLPASEGSQLAQVRDMLLKSPEVFQETLRSEGKAGQHWDAFLDSDRSAYVSFIRELHARGMVSYQTETPVEGCSIFFVFKKDQSLRLICDARRGNQLMVTPPHASCLSFGLGRTPLRRQ